MIERIFSSPYGERIKVRGYEIRKWSKATDGTSSRMEK